MLAFSVLVASVQAIWPGRAVNGLPSAITTTVVLILADIRSVYIPATSVRGSTVVHSSVPDGRAVLVPT